MSKTIKLQVPIKEELKVLGENLAREQGLSSYQELIRFWTVQASKGNLSINQRTPQEGLLVREKEEEYKAEVDRTIKDIKSGKLKPAKTVDDLISRLNKA